jgi:hypothetical protein
VRPGFPALERPTGLSHFPQNRLCSGTSGFARTTLDGSRAATGGTSTSPPPRLVRDEVRRLRLLREVDVAVVGDPRLADGAVPAEAVAGAAPAADVGALARAARPQTLQ